MTLHAAMTSPDATPREHLFGRTDALACVHAALDSGARVATVWGPPGVGKTRLAEEIAGTWEADAFTCLLAEVAHPEQLVGALATAMQLAPLEPGEGPERALEQLSLALAHRPNALLVLDNAEHLAEPLAALLDRFSALPRILVTSRAPIGARGEQWLELRPLAAADSMELFIERAKQVRPDFLVDEQHVQTIETLLEELDHLPLAIELAASRLALLTPEQLLGRMDSRFRLLRPGRVGAARGLSALEDAIDASFSQLTPELQGVLTQLTVFHGSFSLEAAEAVVEPQDPDAWLGDLIEELLFRSLLHVRDHAPTEQRRYVLLLSVRDFARARLEEPFAPQSRHAHHFHMLGRKLMRMRHGKRGMSAVRLAEAEYANMRVAAAWLRDNGLLDEAAETTLDLQLAFVRSGDAAGYLGHLETHHELFTRDPVTAARWRATRADLYRRLGDTARAFALYQESSTELQEAGLDHPLDTVPILVATLRVMSRTSSAEAMLRDALERAQDAPTHGLETTLRLQLCNMVLLRHSRHGVDGDEELSTQSEWLTEAEAQLGTSPDSLELPRLYRTMTLRATLTRDLTRYEEARQRALDVSRAQRRHDLEVQLLCYYSGNCQRFGDYDQAMEFAQEALERSTHMGMLHLRAWSLLCVASLAALLGDTRRAIDVAREGVLCSRRCGEIEVILTNTYTLIIALYEAHEYDEARSWIRELDDHDLAVESARYHHTEVFRALLMANEGRFEAAEELLEEATTPRPWWAELESELFAEAVHGLLELERVTRWLEAGDLSSAQEVVARLRVRHDDMRARLDAEGLIFSFVRILGGRLEEWEQRLPKQDVEHRLRAHPDGSWFEVDGGERVEIGHRETLRRLLEHLLTCQARGQSVTELTAAGWPGEFVEESAAANRVYAGVRTLRRLGLADVLVTDDAGYCIGPAVFIERVQDA